MVDLARNSFENGVNIMDSVQSQAAQGVDISFKAAREVQETSLEATAQWMDQAKRALQAYTEAWKSQLSFMEQMLKPLVPVVDITSQVEPKPRGKAAK